MASGPFVIFSLPRSRSAWLAYYLANGISRVGHDISIECNSPEDFFDCFSKGMLGTVETAGVQAWRLIRARLPEVKFVTIRRPLAEVEDSLSRQSAHFGELTSSELLLRSAMLDEVEVIGGAERIEFSSLSFAPTRRWLWEHLLGEEPFDSEYDERFARTNIQINMPERLEQLARRASANAALAEQVLSLTRGLSPCRKLQ